MKSAIVQCSTIGPEGTATVAQAAREHGWQILDAPVLGTRTPAEKGQLVVLASGDPAPVFYDIGDRLGDMTAKPEPLTPETNPFPVAYGNHTTKMFWNFSEYGHLLTSEFFGAGGKIVMRDFHNPSELAHLPEKVIINCPGYAAHDWWKDKAMVPVRGQTEWLPPQPEVNYGLTYRNVETRSKSDGVMVIQIGVGQFAKSWNNGNEFPDRAEADKAVQVIQELYSRFPAHPV